MKRFSSPHLHESRALGGTIQKSKFHFWRSIRRMGRPFSKVVIYALFESFAHPQTLLPSIPRYRIASLRCREAICSSPSRSAIVRASFRIQIKPPTINAAKDDLSNYIERFHNPRIRKRVARRDMKFQVFSSRP